MASEQDKWHWQEKGTAWKGIGIYHVTLTIPSRQPLLGRLVIPNNDPTQARIERTALGELLLDCQRSVSAMHPEIQVLQYSLMPDHLHSVWYVRKPMEQSISYVVQGFWRAAKKIGRAYSYIRLSGKAEEIIRLSGGITNEKEGASGGIINAKAAREARIIIKEGTLDGELSEREVLSLIAPPERRDNPLREMIGGDAYSSLDPIFTEMPFIRPMSHRGQLQTMIRYVQMNPQRLATKRLHPGFFRVQEGIEIAGRTYKGIGNIALLQGETYATVHVRRTMVEEAEHGDNQRLRDYMNGCVLKARKGTIMISPFISEQEKQVMDCLLKEKHPFIYIADNGFGDYYKPQDSLFDAVADGWVLILSPWDYDKDKHHISRAECVLMNQMADEIATCLTIPQ